MILVTGANGFLGSHLIQLLSRQGHGNIRATYKTHLPENLKQLPNINWVTCDLLDVDAIYQVMEGVTHVYHCANIVSFNPNDAHALMHNNVECTANIVNASVEHGVQKFIFVSSVGAIARESEGKLITEKTPWLQNDSTSVYALSKYKAEMEVWRGNAEGLPIAIVCPSIILGEGNYDKGSAAVFKTVYKQFPFYTSGINGFVDVKDVALAMQVLLNSDVVNQRFILSAGNYSYKSIFTKIALVLKVKPPSIKAGAILSGIAWRWYSVKKIFTGKQEILSRETAQTAQSIYEYDNSKFLNAFPAFKYRSIDETIERVCKDYLLLEKQR